MWCSFTLVAIINEDISNKVSRGIGEAANKFNSKVCLAKHVEDWGADYGPNGGASPISLTNSMRNGYQLIASKPLGTGTINSSNVIFQVLNAVEH